MKIGTKSTIAMKKTFYIITAAALSLVACSRNQEVDIPDANLSIFAKTESPADTKTVVESGVHVFWEPGDEIAVFMGEQSAKFTTDITAASGTATFKGTFGDTTWPEDLDLWAVYPFSEDAVFDGETITTTLPSEQVAREGSFGKDMNLAIAHSSGTTLQFYNVGGGIRFSVTEEGIKKVMFEGLSGEIISGKVKIGMDENGKPEVKEVTGGSQFISLLPPTGQETFEPGASYYIVAIPGTLEGGYKLRFYKDSDYARKVSEKAVEIKRSVYGSLEKADEGIEYGATTTHFPETKEEWEESNYLTERIADDVRHVFYDLLSTSSNNTIDSERFVSEVTNIEGVADYSLIGTDEGIVIVQTDGIHINIIYDYLYSRNDSNPEASNETHNISTKAKSVTIPNTGTKTAALFSPFQNHNIGIKDPIRINVYNLGTSLAGIGYDLKYYPDFETTLNELTPDKLSKYDLVFFVTHGHYKHGIKDQKGKVLETLLTTGQKVGTIDFSLEENIHLANAALFLCDDGVYYSITPLWLMGIENSVGHRASYKNSIIFALACNSFVNNDFADYFTDRGAAVYVGDKYMINGEDSIIAVDGLIKYLAMGASVRKSTELIKKEFSFWGRVFYPLEVSEELQGVAYLIDPTPINLKNTEIRDSRTTLLWEQSKNSGEYKFQVHIKWPNSNSYTTYNSTNSKAYTTDALQPGDYSWYVEANLYYDGKVIETFTSETKNFTVTEELHYETPEAIDLGLPSGTKWASFNLGATKPEEYGYHYAWGETEPKDVYNWSTYKWCAGDYYSMTKYCTNAENGLNGFVDNKTFLEKEDDAVYVNLSKEWRMPTKNEWYEIRDNCTWEWTTEFGEGMYKVTSNINGHYIYLPSGGYRSGPSLLYKEVGYYWSSSIGSSTSALSPTFSENKLTWHYCGHRYQGHQIRPIYPTLVKQIALDETHLVGHVGDRPGLNVSTIPENASRNYYWSSSNESVAKIFYTWDKVCYIELISLGTTTITVTALDGNVSASCKVTVNEKEPMINATPPELNYGDVKVGQSLGNTAGRVEFANTGSADLSISGIDCPEGFSHSPSLTFPIVLSPGDYKTITFAFKPTEAKTYSGYIQVYSNASNGVCKVKVTGNGFE